MRTRRRTVGSVCSGVGGLDLGLHRAGWVPAWFCEAKPYRRRVLSRHWPDVPVYDDLTTLDPKDLCHVDLLAGGTPCTDLSVAGNQAGLDGQQSRLFWDFIRIRNVVEPEWTLWENVEGAFSANKGLDFASVLGAFVGADVPVPAGGWGRAGVVAGPWGGACWRLLDAQFFGVPQRRRRVFVVGRLGGPCPPEVLLERARGGGNPTTRRGSGTRVTASLTSGSSRPGVSAPGRRREDDVNIVVGALDSQRGGSDDNSAQAGHRLVEDEVAGTLTKRYSKGTNRTADEGALVVSSISGKDLEVVGVLGSDAGGATQAQGAPLVLSPPGVAATLQGHRGAGGGGLSPEETRLVADTLRSPLRPGSNSDDTIAFHATQTPICSGERALPIMADGNGVMDGSSVRRLTPTECERLMGWPDGFTLAGGPSLVDAMSTYGSGSMSVVSVSENQRAEVRETEISRQLTAGGGKPGQGYPVVRVEGDASPVTEGDACAFDPRPDGVRYAACGDGVVSAVSEWIGRRLGAVHEGRDPDV